MRAARLERATRCFSEQLASSKSSSPRLLQPPVFGSDHDEVAAASVADLYKRGSTGMQGWQAGGG